MSAKDPPFGPPSKDLPKDHLPKREAVITIDTDGPSITPLLTEPQHGWWDTFNAAITGFCQYKPYLDSGPEYIKIQAKLIADTVHGEYPADPPPPAP